MKPLGKLARPNVFHPRIVLASCPQLVESDGDDSDAEVEFGEEGSEDGSSDSDSSGDDSEAEEAVGEDELGELEAEAADAAGPSSGSKRKREPKEGEAQIVDDASGDEVDPGLIISGGRGTRRGRPAAGGSRPKYTAAAAVDSDEDAW